MTTSEATATIETLREHEAAVADRSRTRIEVPAGVSFLVPPVELTQDVAELITDDIADAVLRHDRGRPVVLLLTGPGWTLLTVPERGLDASRAAFRARVPDADEADALEAVAEVRREGLDTAE